MIAGETVRLYEKTQTGTDEYGVPAYTETPVDVSDVLVAPEAPADSIGGASLYGTVAVYTLSLPKGDTHQWENSTVEFHGRKWQTFGTPTEYTEANVPLRWNKRVHVERIDACSIPVTLELDQPGRVDEYGEPLARLKVETLCRYQDSARTDLTDKKALTQISGTVVIPGDVAPDLPVISGGKATIFGVKRTIQSGQKVRYSDGSVLYTEVILI